MTTFKDKKVITIGIVHELTGLSERRIRYYEERGLIFPERSNKGTRKYSFADIEALMNIANQREEGVQTNEIKKDMLKGKKKSREQVRNEMRSGQLNAYFKRLK